MRLALIAICGSLTAAASANAGEYTVYSCRADDAARNASWIASASSSHVTAYPDGCGSTGGGLVARAGVEAAGSLAASFDAANWRFDAPTGASVTQVALSARLYRASGGRWGVGLSDQAGTYHLGGISSDLMAWESSGYTTITTPGSTTLFFGVICASGSGCTTTSTGQPGWGYSRARADLYGARVRVSESAPPAISGVRGSLISGTWVGGTQSAAFDAADPVGVAGQSWAIASLGGPDSKSCDYTRPAPCPTTSSSQFAIDTRGVPDGEQSLTLAATDSAGNRSTWTGTALIDNNIPGPPSQPVLEGLPATDWRARNGFVLNYRNPSRAGGAPLTSHDVQTCRSDPDGRVDPSTCSFSNLSGAPETDTVQLPRPGTFRTRVRVNDSLYAGAWSPWSEVLRFDDVAPGTPSVSFPARWINASSAAGGLELSTGKSQTPVSGIASYLVGGLGGPERTVFPASSGTALLPYSLLGEGATPVTVRAVSGSGLVTEDSMKAGGTLRKDTIAPSLNVTGAPAPGEKVDYEVTLAASASDSVSGMAPAPGDRPVNEGGYLSFTPEGAGQLLFRGASGQLTPGDGRQAISIFAADVAGNMSQESRVAYTQDTRAPSGGLLPAPGDSPSSIRFQVIESCPGSAEVEISTSPGAWEAVPTTFDDGIAAARVPPAVMDAELPYTLKALVTDCAGNRATLDRWFAGPLAGQPIGEIRPPARTRTTARASMRSSRGSASAASARRTVSGLVRGSDGQPLKGVRVLFESQARATGAPWKEIASSQTSSSGKVSHSLPNRYSQLIRISVPETATLAPSTSNVLKTSVRAASSISASPTKLRNGRRVTVSGRLRGGLVPARFEIALYGRAPGSRAWVPVRAPVAVSRSGRWKVGYRFTRTRTRALYRFRVRIPSRPDYPFSSGYSPERRVTVVP